MIKKNCQYRFALSRHCNYDCQCSRDANFRPVCDSSGMKTFYSPCHAGCTQSNYMNGEKIYSGCKCLLSAGLIDPSARDGSCGNEECQFGWLIFEVICIDLVNYSQWNKLTKNYLFSFNEFTNFYFRPDFSSDTIWGRIGICFLSQFLYLWKNTEIRKF